MAQRDYVGRGRSGTRRKKTSSRKKKGSSGASKTMIALAVAVLVTFAGGLYFIAHNKPQEIPVLPNHVGGKSNGLPPKPEERWRYIKELENRQIGVTTPTEPSAGGEVRSAGELTEEQRQLLEQMQSDMRRQPTQLSEVPYNDQTLVPRSQVFIKPQTTTPASVAPLTQRPNQNVPKTTAPVTTETAKAPVDKPEKAPRWMIQCGSFKAMAPAESIRAQLAFAGVESRITSSGGWNRIILGPYGSRATADKMIQKLKSMGNSSCIPLASGG
ncbi:MULTISPECIES: cell division protein FtsN [Lonsdalea]|uniref:Cell division protein FtsN n=1 Tax=Lonsdalea populi TaxID=1172565 RepID=A0A3N0U987_9GAMM|nr:MULTISPECIES: cell division protein FtsN [Lonsdalea]QPQ24073.1 cell division protein FtsN [Lonsdalea populi]ROH75750.1 cell division protein FtsN [Lonsdalea populi]ROH76482.1 cell division protein FtsN [Lonsdalea populi]ROH76771.1 cell division protein FtsN [Lonsdalea populi]